jgi:hypothetical protein
MSFALYRGQCDPCGRLCSSAEDRVRLADDRVSLADGRLSVADGRVSVADDRVSVADGRVSCAKDDGPSAIHDYALAEDSWRLAIEV